MTTQLLGDTSETLAAEYLQQHGLQFIERNFRSRYGEIDLIMHTTSHLVFVEVRYRKLQSFGHPIETVTYHKQQKLLRTAHYYLQTHPVYQNIDYRFDIIGITFSLESPHIEWIQDAFS
jgi:putative endonuclease